MRRTKHTDRLEEPLQTTLLALAPMAWLEEFADGCARWGSANPQHPFILEVVFIATYVISEEAYGNAERHLYNRKP